MLAVSFSSGHMGDGRIWKAEPKHLLVAGWLRTACALGDGCVASARCHAGAATRRRPNSFHTWWMRYAVCPVAGRRGAVPRAGADWFCSHAVSIHGAIQRQHLDARNRQPTARQAGRCRLSLHVPPYLSSGTVVAEDSQFNPPLANTEVHNMNQSTVTAGHSVAASYRMNPTARNFIGVSAAHKHLLSRQPTARQAADRVLVHFDQVAVRGSTPIIFPCPREGVKEERGMLLLCSEDCLLCLAICRN